MKKFVPEKFWSPYVVGTGIGVLSTVSIYSIGKTLGTSSTFVHIIGFIEGLLFPEYAHQSLYLQKICLGKALFDWQFALVLGLFIGAKISSTLFQSVQTNRIPPLWGKYFGQSFKKRAFFAFIGGVLILFGARLAGGCTSGKAISSGLQLGISAWIFIATLFITGIITANIFYRK